MSPSHKPADPVMLSEAKHLHSSGVNEILRCDRDDQPGRGKLLERLRVGIAVARADRGARARWWWTALLLLGVVLAPWAARPVQAGVTADADSKPTAEAPPPAEEADWMTRLDEGFGRWVVDPLGWVLFFDFGTSRWLGTSVPLVVLWLLLGAIFFTLKMRLISFRGFWHSIRLTKGDYDDPADTGEVSHFQALASALSATVGLGNIAGVAIAVATGGPGAIFWLIVAGLLGMSTKFTECTLSQMYRKVDHDGTVSGGAMHYLRDGLAELGWPRLGLLLSVVFALMCMGGSFGGGCVFQISQSLKQVQLLERLQLSTNVLTDHSWIYGVAMIFLAGVVIIGGIRRIAATAEKIVPLMCGIYVLASLYILAVHWAELPGAFATIFREAFSPAAAYGGFLGVMVIGIRRAAFSNEAGIGSAPIAHAAAKTEEPVSEGIVALLEPFIDTVVICTMTGLVIVITGVHNDPRYAHYVAADEGAPLTSVAFASVLWWFPWILTVAVVLFAYSTLISWSYYGERCWSYLFGHRWSVLYKCLFLGFVFLGSIVTTSKLLLFSDFMILSMAFPNILGVVMLSGKVRRRLDDYWGRYKSGQITVRTGRRASSTGRPARPGGS